MSEREKKENEPKFLDLSSQNLVIDTEEPILRKESDDFYVVEDDLISKRISQIKTYRYKNKAKDFDDNIFEDE